MYENVVSVYRYGNYGRDDEEESSDLHERCICICGAVTFYFDIVSVVHNDAEL